MNKDKTVVHEPGIPFVEVEWGRTKVLVGVQSEAQSERLVMKITEYLPGFAHKMHVHPGQEEIIFVLSGKGITETVSGKKDINPGDIVHIPGDVYHATYNPYDETLRAVIIKAPPDKG